MTIFTEASSVNIWYDLALVGIGIVATLVGGVLMKLLETKVNRIGELAIYYRVVDVNKDFATIRIQVKNASHEVKFLRNLSLYIINEDIQLQFIQTEKSVFKSNNIITDTKFYGKDGSYSLTSDARSLNEYELKFLCPLKLDTNDKCYFTFIDDNEVENRFEITMQPALFWTKANYKGVKKKWKK